MDEKTYGYIRVSTREQNEDRQLIALQEFPIPARRIFMDKMSGKDFQRPQYQHLLRLLKPGNILVVKSIDRLGRNYSQILDQWRKITKSKEAAVVVLDMPLLDTRRGKDLTGILIADIVLQLLSYVAQTERENTRKRQREGIFAAQSRSVHFGPQRMELPENFPALADLWRQGGISSRQAALSLGISYQTFLRRAKEWEPAQ